MYRKMMEQARRDGVASESSMWKSIDNVEELLDKVRETYPCEYTKFMRRQHELMYGPHYNEVMAMEAVAQLMYTDKDGEKHEGPYWTLAQIEEATRSMTFPRDTTKWDKFVAFNSFKSDVAQKLDDSTTLQVAHAFYFADEDYSGEGKIWHYINCMGK